MSLISRLIRNADDELRYPNSGELEQMEAFFRTGEQRLKIAERLSDQEENIIDDATQAFQAACPNANLDYAPYFRYVVYRIVAGDQALPKNLNLKTKAHSDSMPLSEEEKVAGTRCLKAAICQHIPLSENFNTDPYFENLI